MEREKKEDSDPNKNHTLILQFVGVCNGWERGLLTPNHLYPQIVIWNDWFLLFCSFFLYSFRKTHSFVMCVRVRWLNEMSENNMDLLGSRVIWKLMVFISILKKNNQRLSVLVLFFRFSFCYRIDELNRVLNNICFARVSTLVGAN